MLGGARITFHDLKISCGRRDERLINANLFINQGGRSRLPPRDVVCEDCTFGAWAAHTVSIQHSLRSGVTGSTLCVARFPQLTLAVGDDASDPRVSGNRDPAVRARQAHARARAARGRLRRTAPAARALPRPAGGDARRGAGAAARDAEGRPPRLDAHEAERPLPARPAPAIGELVRLRSGSLRGPSIQVGVRPRVVLRRRGSSLVVESARGPLLRRTRRRPPGSARRPLGHRAGVELQRIARPLARPSTVRSSASQCPGTRLPACSQRRAEASVSGEIFVVGASRSGTNLVRALLNAHSTLWVSGETHYFDDLRPRLPGAALRSPAQTASAASATSSHSRTVPSARPATPTGAASSATSCARWPRSSAARATRTSRRSAASAPRARPRALGREDAAARLPDRRAARLRSPRRRSCASCATPAPSSPRTRTGTARPPGAA